jgi:hypothetical protein
VSGLGHRWVASEHSLCLVGVLWVGADGGGGENVDLSSLFHIFIYFQNPLTNEAEGRSGRKIIKMACNGHMMGWPLDLKPLTNEMGKNE